MSIHPFVPFESDAVDTHALGADALLYVMAHEHAVTVPTAALYFAEKVAYMAIADKDTPEKTLVRVNRAIDMIAATIRVRERLDREDTPAVDTTPAPQAPPSGRPGKFAALQPQPINRPPSGVKVEIPF